MGLTSRLTGKPLSYFNLLDDQCLDGYLDFSSPLFCNSFRRFRLDPKSPGASLGVPFFSLLPPPPPFFFPNRVPRFTKQNSKFFHFVRFFVISHDCTFTRLRTKYFNSIRSFSASLEKSSCSIRPYVSRSNILI